MEYTNNTGEKFDYEELKHCPFCGHKPIIKWIGNDYTKSRKVTIKCSNHSCRCEITNAGIRYDHILVFKVSADAWNLRK